MIFLRRQIRNLDFVVIGTLVLLAVYGTIAVLAATTGNTNPDIPRHILLKQVIYEVIGFAAMSGMIVFDYRSLREMRWWLYGISVFLLLVVFGFPAVQGAHSWINLKVITLQPSEIAKLSLIIWLAAFMAQRDEEATNGVGHRIASSWVILPIFLIPFALTYKEPALGQALVMVAIVLTMYTVFAKRSHFAIVIVWLIVLVLGFSVVNMLFPTQATDFINNVLVKHHILRAYQINRITTWINPHYSMSDYGFNIHMAQTAIGSGGMFGQGFLKGIETQGGFVPNQWTDYIFSAIGEEFGFIGSSLLIVLFFVLFYRLIKIAKASEDFFGMYIIVGIVGMFGFQVFENIGMDIYLSPSTGITLPFMSYGGSSLIVDFMAVGLALGIGVRSRKLSFAD